MRVYIHGKLSLPLQESGVGTDELLCLWELLGLLRGLVLRCAVAYLNVLDCNTTHFVGFDGSCRRKIERGVGVLSMAASEVVALEYRKVPFVVARLATPAAPGNTSARR